MLKKNANLKRELDSWYDKICTKNFIDKDPVQFPRRYSKREDVEIAAFLAATIAWGRRDLILRSANKMFAIMGKSPYDYIISGGYKNLKKQNIHRTFFEDDLKYFCRGFEHCYAKYGNLEKLFASAEKLSEKYINHELVPAVRTRTRTCGTHTNEKEELETKVRGFRAVRGKNSYIIDNSNIWQGIALFREEMAKANKGKFSKHISNPGPEDRNGSACKRLNLALRWLVRKGPVDLGLWKSLKTSALFIPLDVHVARTARELGLTSRNANDKKSVMEITEKLREFCPEDPVKYDYALFGIGIEKNK